MSTWTAGITVIVPTFKRPVDLDRCLAAIEEQSLKPAEILIAYRAEDEATQAYLARQDRPGLSARLILCDRPGQVYAMTVGIDNVRSEFFAFTDDDGAPAPDWLERIVVHFQADPKAAGVGGKDYVCVGGVWFEGEQPVVGRIRWNGRAIGFHHLGVGPARYVECLKGVNMAFRRSAFDDLRPDSRLRGKGAQVGSDLHLSLSVVARGYKLIYDPKVLVYHYPGERPVEEDRVLFNPVTLGDEVFNQTLILMEFMATQRWGRLRQAAMLAHLGLRGGGRKSPGLMLLVYGLLTGYPNTWARFKTTFAAYREALAAAGKTSGQPRK